MKRIDCILQKINTNLGVFYMFVKKNIKVKNSILNVNKYLASKK